MKPVNYNHDGKGRTDVLEKWFVGSPSLSDLSDDLNIGECKVFHVTFPQGSKTKLHYHRGGQMLIVTEGSGVLEIFSKTGDGASSFEIKSEHKIELKKGSIQYIPAGVLHTHGSAGKEALSHVAVNYPSAEKSYDTIWFESDFEKNVTEEL